MYKKNRLIIPVFIFLNLFISLQLSAQKNLYAGIEIGRNTIKVSVLEVNNIKKAEYSILYFWTENVKLAKHIAAYGEITHDDISRVGIVTYEQLGKIRSKFKIPEENIYLVAAPGVASARNIGVLRNKITSLTSKDLDLISEKEEVKILVKGSIPPVNYADALLLDIGAKSTKGGYMNEIENHKLEFSPIELDLGTMTLTAAVEKTVINQNEVHNMLIYQQKAFDYIPILREKIKGILDTNTLLLKKEKIYLSGGALWALVTLYYNDNIKDNYVPLNMEDIMNYDAILKNNFTRFIKLAKTNKEAAKVLNTYSQRHLISANNILVACMESLPDLKTKKLYFVKQAQTAWLISYIADRSLKVNIDF